MSSMIRVVVADGLMLFRSAVVSLLQEQSDFATCAVGDADELIAAISASAFDVALIDLDLPPAGAIPILEASPELRRLQVVVWAGDTEREAISTALRAGAVGFLSKRISPAGLVRALRAVTAGEAVLPRDLTRLAIDALHAAESRAWARDRAASLSDRERDVLRLVARGFTNREISAELFISEFTAKRHVHNILDKLEMPSRRAAALLYHSAFEGLKDDRTLRRATPC